MEQNALVALAARLVVNCPVLVAVPISVLQKEVGFRRVVHHGALRLEPLQRELHVVVTVMHNR